ncbi:MAG: flagellar biosynthesis protein [Bacteroidetes bacterium]|jgi:flagellar operon protein|nr:flagellar biosynthesis protein [Bacteroidota bacterium]
MNVRQLASRVDPAQRVAPDQLQRQQRADQPQKGSFEETLRKLQEATDDLQVSAHARQRIAERGISLEGAERQALIEGLEQLQSKGATDALMLREDAAFVVNVPNRTVITAMDRTEMQDRTFTQIDSALLL